MVLAQDTDFILLDEPLNNLDIKQSVSMMQILRRLVEELGKTIIIVLHDINMASQYADEIVAFKDGQVFARERLLKSCRLTCSVNFMRFPSHWLISMAKDLYL